jgi:fumarate reductase flavoprotein subunit
MARIIRSSPDDQDFSMSVPVVVVGAGGCGLSAALAVRDAGVNVLVLERDSRVAGTTAMSTGLIPASGTTEQAARGIADSPEQFSADIMQKTKGRTDADIALLLARESVETVQWLRDGHGVPLTLIDDFLYPGHSAMRMYGTPNRTGSELMAGLEAACVLVGVDILTDACVDTIIVDAEDRVLGIEYVRPNGLREKLGCEQLILACCGFGGNWDMVIDFIPELKDAVFHGHPGNKGDAMAWGVELGAALADMHSYQGHGGLAAGHAIPILWPFIMEGGFQVNAQGSRFSDESLGYSEQAVKVLAQPGHVAWSVLDQHLHDLMMKFDDFQLAVAAKAVVRADDVAALAARIGVPEAALQATFSAVDAVKAGAATDQFGRDFSDKPPLAAPFYAAKVTGALFHTQGGLVVDHNARVLRTDGTAFPNLFAGGGAARGISGAGADGYLAGNGLLTATTFGRLAGRAAALQSRSFV